MSTTPIQEEYTAMQGGLHTDSTQLAPKKGSSRDEANYELLRDGSRRRRRPILEEEGAGTTFKVWDRADAINWNSPSAYIWSSPAHRSDLSIVVENVGSRVFFYRKNQNSTTTLRNDQIGEVLELRFWGSYNAGILPTTGRPAIDRAEREREPCTYTEGGGNLYIFHPNTGCIKVTLSDDGTTLKYAAVGTWIRDYEGAQENISADYRPVLTNTPSTTVALLSKWYGTLDHSVTIDPTGANTDATKDWKPTDALNKERAYNLSNSGWDAKSVGQFAYESSEPTSKYVRVRNLTSGDTTFKWQTSYRNDKTVWPALTDHYAKGRIVAEDGTSTFSYTQMIEAKEGGSRPPMGARVTHSSVVPAGTLAAEPNKTTATMDTSSGFLRLVLTFNQPIFPATQGAGAPVNGKRLVFFHNLLVRVNSTKYGNKILGFSGVLPCLSSPGNNNKCVVVINNPLLTTATHTAGDWSTASVISCTCYPAPPFFPHGVDSENATDYSLTRRSSCGEFFTGRLFQGSDEHERVYFGQVSDISKAATGIATIHRESMCYMAADPTDPDDNASVATDGGYIATSGSGRHYALKEWNGTLYLFAEAGIWAITPGSKGVFLPSDYRVRRVFSGEVLGPRAVTVSSDSLYVGTTVGLLKVTQDGMMNLVDGRVRDVWDTLRNFSDTPVVRYDEKDRRVLVVRQGAAGSVNGLRFLNQQTMILTYHELHDAWTKDVYPVGGIVTDALVLPQRLDNSGAAQIRYQTMRYINTAAGPSYVTTFCRHVEVTNTRLSGPFNDFRDYPSPSPVPVERREEKAFMLSNEVLGGGGAQFTAIHYAIVHNQRTDTDGSTMMQCLWDFFDQEYHGKFSPLKETYRPRRSLITNEPNGEPVIVAKQKVPGRGREFRVRFESSTGKDSHLIGYTITGMVLNGV